MPFHETKKLSLSICHWPCPGVVSDICSEGGEVTSKVNHKFVNPLLSPPPPPSAAGGKILKTIFFDEFIGKSKCLPN